MSVDRKILRRVLLTAEQSRSVDATLIAAGVPSTILMENAGFRAAEWIRAADTRVRQYAVLCGTGNNGGDGYVVARQLFASGNVVRVYALSTEKLSPDCHVMAYAWRAIGGEIRGMDTLSELAGEDLSQWLIIDALFGTGLNRAVESRARDAVVQLNGIGARVVALDVPSGFSADRGVALGEAVRASDTLTFGTSKPGLHTGSASEFAGRISVISLGAPVPTSVASSCTHELVDGVDLSPRGSTAHKGTAGRVVIVGGIAPTQGAGVLTSYAAHRAGAGLVTLARDSTATNAVQPETMVQALSADVNEAIATLKALTAKECVLVVGPGLGMSAWARDLVLWAKDQPMIKIFDGDALTHLASMGAELDERTVLTPHPLEAGRLLGESSASAVQADRFAALHNLLKRYRCNIVLKGAGTLVGVPGQRTQVLPFAEPTLGVAGSGDVLAGAIAARAAETLENSSLFDAIVEGCWLHGRAGARLHAARNTARGVLASEIADEIAAVFQECEC